MASAQRDADVEVESVDINVHTAVCDRDGERIGCELYGDGDDDNDGFRFVTVDDAEFKGHVLSTVHTLPGHVRTEYEFFPEDTGHCEIVYGDEWKLKCTNTARF